MTRQLLIIVITCLAVLTARAQRVTAEQYIDQYKDIAISEMKRMGVPAAITLAQGLLETESGNSVLVKKSNNHFGIKCKSTWTGDTVSHDDDANGECFRAYKTPEESYRDHSNFLRGNKRYASLFSLEVADYKGWAYGLKRAGYATNPRYPEILIKNIEQYNLQQYTLSGAGEVPVFGNPDSPQSKEPPVMTPSIENAVTIITEGIKEEMNSVLDMPAKVITVNSTRCVYAKRGTSLLVIATRNDVNLKKLLEYNELAEDGILAKDQYVYLQKKSKTGSTDFYIAQEGETMYDVAQKNGIQLQYLMDYNQWKEDQPLEAGTRLLLQPVKAEKNKPAVTTVKKHTVAPKEGLYSIAKKYGVTVDQLREWNHLDSDRLSIGQELIVSR